MTRPARTGGLFRAVDCVQLPVPDLDAALAFYRDRLGHRLLWRTGTAAGLRLADSDTELVLATGRPQPEVDLLVDSADEAAAALVAAGGTILVEPFEIPVGRLAVVGRPVRQPPDVPRPLQGPLRHRRRRQRDRGGGRGRLASGPGGGGRSAAGSGPGGGGRGA